MGLRCCWTSQYGSSGSIPGIKGIQHYEFMEDEAVVSVLLRCAQKTPTTCGRIATLWKPIEYKTCTACGRIWRYRLPSTIGVCAVGASLRNYRQMQNNKRGHLLCKEKRDGRLEPKHFDELYQSSKSNSRASYSNSEPDLHIWADKSNSSSQARPANWICFFSTSLSTAT